jgi:hypothetical protein
MFRQSLLGFLLVFLIIALPVSAQHFTSPSYIIDWGNFNITSGKKNSTNYSLTDTVGQIAPGPYTSSGYQLRSGFQYIYDTLNNAFSFQISSLDIAFGTLVPGVGTTRSHTITISTPSGHGYTVNVVAASGFANNIGITIPPTACDSGPCTTTSSSPWTLASTYGFGYNVIGINSSGVATGVGTSQFFSDATYFRPFARAPQDLPPTIMSESAPAKDHSARVSYKTNINSLQASGSYTTSIIFTAIPQY